ncbi:Uncharacterised protein at_DN1858 [Pycnogonum litorale]
MAAELDVLKTVVHKIVDEKLGYRKVSARWVPKQLTDEHKRKLLEHMTCVNHTTTESKVDSMTRKHHLSPKIQSSAICKEIAGNCILACKRCASCVDFTVRGKTIKAVRNAGHRPIHLNR